MDFVLDLIGRYLLVGIILWGIWLIMLVARMVFLSFKLYGDSKLIDSMQTGTKEGAIKYKYHHLLAELLFWPYWVIVASREYFKRESEAIRRIG